METNEELKFLREKVKLFEEKDELKKQKAELKKKESDIKKEVKPDEKMSKKAAANEVLVLANKMRLLAGGLIAVSLIIFGGGVVNPIIPLAGFLAGLAAGAYFLITTNQFIEYLTKTYLG